MEKQYISVVGSLNYDILINQERLPLKGETYTAESVSYEGGGKGANQAVQCAKLGVPTYMCGKVGADNFGNILRKKLLSYGVDCTYLEDSQKDTGLGIVHVLDKGEVYATIITGANYDIGEQELATWKEVIINSKIVILQMELPISTIEKVIYLARKHHVCIILNAAPAKDISPNALKLVDYFIANESEASYYAKEQIHDEETAKAHIHKLTELTDGTVIITLGASGSLLCKSNEYMMIPACKAAEVVETTGAGDSYIGAFAYSKFIGKDDVEACLYAAKVSAITVTKVGAQGAMPYLHDVQ